LYKSITCGRSIVLTQIFTAPKQAIPIIDPLDLERLFHHDSIREYKSESLSLY
jgi:hypothetical protein